MGECFLDDDGSLSGEFIAVEAGDEPQALWVRVGSVWDDGQPRTEPGVWISWQDEYMNSSMGGPVLLTPAVWRELAHAVEWRLRRKERRWGKLRSCWRRSGR